MIKKTTEEFINQSNKIHNNKYDYSVTNYNGARENLLIICPVHGEFNQIASNHLNGKECPKCSLIKRAKTQSKSTETFIIDAQKIHGQKYDYSRVNYITAESKIIIICPVHGEFNQIPYNHLSNSGCPRCSEIQRNLAATLTTEEFITRANRIHKDKYVYNLVNYIKSNKKVKITCKKHGIFKQKPNKHLLGQGCPKCAFENGTSKGEKEVLEFIKSIYPYDIIENNRMLISPYELDIYLPKLNLAIEYNGTYWHKLHELKKPGYHKLKETLCLAKNIKLINIAEADWVDNKQQIKDFISRIV